MAASKMAAASTTLSYARGVSKDIGIFAGQAAAVQRAVHEPGPDPLLPGQVQIRELEPVIVPVGLQNTALPHRQRRERGVDELALAFTQPR